jgi:hypothetical protein
MKVENVLLIISQAAGLAKNALDEKLVSTSLFGKHLVRYA